MNPRSVWAARVLLVDSYPDSAATMAAMLKLWGYLPLVALDGITGLEMALSQRPDAIFLEVSLPRMDGHAVARRIRAEEGMEKTPLLALTGWGRPCDVQDCLAAGFDRHLLKPVNPEELRPLLAAVVADREGPSRRKKIRDISGGVPLEALLAPWRPKQQQRL